MTIKVKLDLMKIDSLTFTESFDLTFESITEITGFAETYVDQLTDLSLEVVSATDPSDTKLYAYINQESQPHEDFVAPDIHQCSENGYLIFTCNFEDRDIDILEKAIQLGILTLDVDGNTSLIVYKQNSENDALSKSLTLVDIIQGKFNHMIALKNVNIDVINYSFNYNYVFIPSLKRYYYVDSVEIVSADVTRLHLKEDVLMTWKTLIKSQSAFVTRSSIYNGNLVDTRMPLKDVKSVTILSSSNVVDTNSQNSLVNITFDYNNNYSKDKPNILVTSLSTDTQTYRPSGLSAPANSGLPDLSTHLNNREWVNFIQPSKLFYLVSAYLSNDAISSYINSVIWLPFDPTDAFDLHTTNTLAIYVKDKYIDSTGNYVNSGGTGTPLTTYRSQLNSNIDGVCPYLIVKDFTLSVVDEWFNHEPYAYYEMYVPFVGWVQVDSTKILNKRLLIYYSMDLQTGISTAYIYNYTDKYVVWSGTCQIGIKIDITTTNQIENIKQKQANDLNMVLGLISSALAVGVGVATENPVAVAGGILNAGKTIASNVNSNNMLFERAQTTFGSSDNAMHTPKEIQVRKTYHSMLDINETTYENLQGYPCNDYRELNSLIGYVEIGEIHFDPMNADIYQDEITEIVNLLQSGVIF